MPIMSSDEATRESFLKSKLWGIEMIYLERVKLAECCRIVDEGIDN